MASQSSKRSSEEPHYTQGLAKRLHRAASEPLLGLSAPANAPFITPPSTPPSSSSNTPATNISSPTMPINRPASPVRPTTPKTPSKAAGQWVPATKDIFEMSLEETHAYMRLVGWEIPSWKSIPYDNSSDLDHEEALWLGEDGDEDQ